MDFIFLDPLQEHGFEHFDLLQIRSLFKKTKMENYGGIKPRESTSGSTKIYQF